jgi:hypothetical protein
VFVCKISRFNIKGVACGLAVPRGVRRRPGERERESEEMLLLLLLYTAAAASLRRALLMSGGFLNDGRTKAVHLSVFAGRSSNGQCHLLENL